MQRFLNKLVPFVLLGVAVLFFALGIMLLAYIVMIGAVVGVVLFLVSFIRNKFFPPKTPAMAKPEQKKTGRVIDSDDWKEL